MFLESSKIDILTKCLVFKVRHLLQKLKSYEVGFFLTIYGGGGGDGVLRRVSS